MKHPADSIFKVENVLNLNSWFSFHTSCPSSLFKTYLFLSFWFLRERSINIFLFVEHPVFVQSILVLDCWFFFVTIFSNSVFSKRNNNIDRKSWEMAWTLLVDFYLLLLTRIPYVKHTNCENYRSAAKEVSISLLSWNNLSINSSNLFATTFKSMSKTYFFEKILSNLRKKSKY